MRVESPPGTVSAMTTNRPKKNPPRPKPQRKAAPRGDSCEESARDAMWASLRVSEMLARVKRWAQHELRSGWRDGDA